MKMGLRIVASIINISFDGRPPVSLGTAVVDLLTIIPCSSDEMLGSVLCARKAHLFSEQERNKGAIYIALLRSCKRKQTSIYKHFIPTGFMCPRNLLRKQELRPLLHRLHRFKEGEKEPNKTASLFGMVLLLSVIREICGFSCPTSGPSN